MTFYQPGAYDCSADVRAFGPGSIQAAATKKNATEPGTGRFRDLQEGHSSVTKVGFTFSEAPFEGTLHQGLKGASASEGFKGASPWEGGACRA